MSIRYLVVRNGGSTALGDKIPVRKNNVVTILDVQPRVVNHSCPTIIRVKNWDDIMPLEYYYIIKDGVKGCSKRKLKQPGSSPPDGSPSGSPMALRLAA